MCIAMCIDVRVDPWTDLIQRHVRMHACVDALHTCLLISAPKCVKPCIAGHSSGRGIARPFVQRGVAYP